ncbi:hypothetical protein C8P66_105177 [Humitalea rosea]|uniref:Uncharacterized protein n=1 Tax=Humitalea rosea TaxID=990373 RepID=A0A2W7IQH9_9PROT|nr:hypothetical protein [Humitalea rosea]PZW48427.1 hypothetical protein C8P66_105177 [Humitalea rosea]
MLRRLALIIALLAAGLAQNPALAQKPAPGQAPATTAAPAANGDPSFTLVNRSRFAILEAYVSLATETAWGPDRLSTAVVAPGASLALTLPAGACGYDVRIVYQGGPPPEERRGIDLCRVTELVITGRPVRAEGPRGKGEPAEAAVPTGNPSFNLVNRSGQVIQQAFVSAAVMADWGPDVLGTEVLANDAHLAIRLPQGDCLYDVKVVYEGGRTEERRAVNTCDIANLMFQ